MKEQTPNQPLDSNQPTGADGANDAHLRYLLTAYLFDSISGDGRREVESHLENCESCRDELEELRATLSTLEDALVSTSDASGSGASGTPGKAYSFEERRLERVLEASRRRSWIARHPHWTRGIAAVAVIAVTLWIVLVFPFSAKRAGYAPNGDVATGEPSIRLFGVDMNDASDSEVLALAPADEVEAESTEGGAAGSRFYREDGAVPEGLARVPASRPAAPRKIAPPAEEAATSTRRNRAAVDDLAAVEDLKARASSRTAGRLAAPTTNAELFEKQKGLAEKPDFAAPPVALDGLAETAAGGRGAAQRDLHTAPRDYFADNEAYAKDSPAQPARPKVRRLAEVVKDASKEVKELADAFEPRSVPGVDGRVTASDDAGLRTARRPATREPEMTAEAEEDEEVGEAYRQSFGDELAKRPVGQKKQPKRLEALQAVRELGRFKNEVTAGASAEARSQAGFDAAGGADSSPAETAEKLVERQAPEEKNNVAWSRRLQQLFPGLQEVEGDAARWNVPKGSTPSVAGGAGDDDLMSRQAGERDALAPATETPPLVVDESRVNDYLAWTYKGEDDSQPSSGELAGPAVDVGQAGAQQQAARDQRRAAEQRYRDADFDGRYGFQKLRSSRLGRGSLADQQRLLGMFSEEENNLRAYAYYNALDPSLSYERFQARPLNIPSPLVGDAGLGQDGFRERYGVHPFVSTRVDPYSTFGLDVDTASYHLTRNHLAAGRLPPPETVRVEEFINSFPDPRPAAPDAAFSVFCDGGPAPFARGLDLLKITVKSRDLRAGERKPVVLTFAIDTSGSMAEGHRMGIVRRSLHTLVDALSEGDRVAIVAFGANAYVVLPHTGVRDASFIKAAIDSLSPMGNTNVEAGLDLAYRLADEALQPRAMNRVVVCSDGVANVGARGPDEILRKVKVFARRGIYLNAIGIGAAATAGAEDTAEKYKDTMLLKLANQGNGNYHYVDRPETAARIFQSNLPATLQVLAEDAKIQVHFRPEVVTHYRLLGYEKRDVADKDFRNDKVDAGEVGPGTTVTVLYEIERNRNASGSIGKVYLRYRDTETRRVEEVDFDIPPGVIATELAKTPDRFRFIAAVAEFAELLRGSYFARDGSFGSVLEVLHGLAHETKSTREWQEAESTVRQAQAVVFQQISRPSR